MPQVTVTIAGRTYRMACGEGEEAHLEGLAAAYDGKIQDLRGALGELGDMRLHVMAAIMIADELAETRAKLNALEREAVGLRAQADTGPDDAETRAAEALTRAAERVERITRSLSAPAAEADG